MLNGLGGEQRPAGVLTARVDGLRLQECSTELANRRDLGQELLKRFLMPMLDRHPAVRDQAGVHGIIGRCVCHGSSIQNFVVG